MEKVPEQETQESQDDLDDSLDALRRRMERISAKIVGDTTYLNALADQVAGHKNLTELSNDPESKA